MRDPKRIEPFLAKLAELWNNHPDMRFNQLMRLVNNDQDSFHVFNVEDDKTLEAIERLLKDE